MEHTSNTALLKLLTKREHYLSYRQYIKDDVLGDIQKDLLYAYSKYFDEFPSKDFIDLSEFKEWYFHGYKPDLDDTQRSLVLKVIKAIVNSSEEVGSKIIIKFHELQTRELILESCENKFNVEYIDSLCEKHNEFVSSVIKDDEYISFDDQSIFEKTDRNKGLKFRLNCLNYALGSLIVGDLVIIGAYTDVGKTRFLCSEVSHMATQVKEGTILWLNNEEPNERIQAQLMSATLQRPQHKIRENHATAVKYYENRMHGDVNRVKVVDITGKTVKQVEKLIKKYKPVLTIIDQSDKIAFKAAWSEAATLGDLYGQLRGLAKRYCPIICASQAARPRLDKDGNPVFNHYRHHSELHASGVDKPGEADIIIMIAHDPQFPTSRFLHVSKNKYGDKHKFEVNFNGELSLYYDR